jgi:hypothetical protein
MLVSMTQPPWWWNSVFPAALAIVSSVVVAFLSNRLASKRENTRMIQERAFRETVDWYFRITWTLVDFMFSYAELATPIHSGDREQERQREIRRNQVELSRKLTAETIEAHCYAPVETLGTLQTLQSNLSQLSTLQDPDVVRIRQEMQLAHFSLAQFMRRLLGLEELPKKVNPRSASPK